MTSEELRVYQEEKMSESDIQIAFVRWLDSFGVYYEIGLEGIYLPNPHPKGSKAWKIQAGVNRGVLNKMKREGFKKGPADVKVYLDNILLHIELKTVKKGVHSSEQKETESKINSTSYSKYSVCKGITAAKEFVSRYSKEFHSKILPTK